MSTASSLLIGSRRKFADQTVTIDGSPEVISAPLDGIYVWDVISARSLATQLEVAMAAAGVPVPVVDLLENGVFRITGGAVFSITWGSGTLVRDMLGFAGDLSGSASYDAPTTSEWLWIPGTTETPEDAPLGVSGARTYDSVRVVAPDSTQVTRKFGDPVRRNRLEWTYIQAARFYTTAEAGGELTAFFDRVLSCGAKFKHYRLVNYDQASTAIMSLGGTLGPYEMAEDMPSLPLRRSRGLETVEKMYDFAMRVLVVPEYS